MSRWRSLAPFTRASVAVFVLALGIILWTFPDYGVIWDEPFHVAYGDGVLAYYTSGFSDDESYRYANLFYYGAAFDLLCAVAAALSPLGLYETRHLLNALVGLIAVLGCWKLSRQLGTERTAFLAVLVLFLTPRWWGHSFNNPKDIPFAAGYIWSIYYLVRVMPLLPRVPFHWSMRLGAAIGLTLAIRVGGLMLFGYLGLLMATALVVRKDESFPTRCARAAVSFVGAAAPAWVIMLVFWPWAHSNPFRAPIEALEVMSSFTWRGTVLFDGSLIHATQIPRSYTPQWLLVSLPEVILAALALGLCIVVISALRGGIGMSSMSTYRHAFVVFTVLFPVVYIAAQQTIIYDGMRHVLFIVPILACLTARTIETVYDQLRSRGAGWSRLAVGAMALYLAYLSVIMIRLHPNQYVYFNQLVGGLPGAYGRYETDYWGNSYREAIDRLVEHLESESDAPAPYRVFVCSNPPSSTYFFPPYLARTREDHDADFLVGTTRWDCHKRMEGDVIAVVERLDTPLNYVVDRRHLVPPRRRH